MTQLPLGKGQVLRTGRKRAILAWGPMLHDAAKAADELDATLVNMRFVKPLDESLLRELAKTHEEFITIEDGAIQGGAGSAVNEFLMRNKLMIPSLNLGLPDHFVPQGSQAEMYQALQLDAAGIINQIRSW